MRRPWLLALGMGIVMTPAAAETLFSRSNEDQEGSMRFYLIASSVGLASASMAMAQGIPQLPSLPPGSNISVAALSVNGVPPTVTHTKIGPGTIVSATASSTPGGTASAFASAYAFAVP